MSKILNEIGVNGTSNSTYEFSNKFDLNRDEKDKSLPVMYWKPKMHTEPIGARFIVASNKCSIWFVSKTVSKGFGLIFQQI